MSMTKRPAIWAMMTALILGLTTVAAAQDQQKEQNQKGRRNQQQEQPQAQPPTVGPMPQSKDELDGFLAVQNEQSTAKKIELADGFITKYPNSDFIAYAQTFRVGA